MSTKNPIFSKTILQKIKIFKTFPDKQKFREVLVVVSLKKKKVHERARSLQSCPTLCNPMDYI